MAADRPGIVSAASETIFKLSGNIVALSQTVLKDYFTILIIADFPSNIAVDKLRTEVERGGNPGEFAVMVRPYEKTELPAVLLSPDATQFMLSATGDDRKGVIFQISRILGKNRINIMDIATHLEGNQFVLVAQILVPPDLDVRCIQDELAAIGTSGNLSIHLQHINIFKETNRI